MFAVVEQKLGTEDSQRRSEQACSAVGMVARATSGKESGPVLDALEVTRRCGKPRDPAGGSRDCTQSEGAGAALTSTLRGEVREDSSGLHDTATSRRQHRDHSAAERIAKRAERPGIQGQRPGCAGLDPAAE